jgi:hypothetical protein
MHEIGRRWLTPERLSIFLSSRAAKAIRSMTSCRYLARAVYVIALRRDSCGDGDALFNGGRIVGADFRPMRSFNGVMILPRAV